VLCWRIRLTTRATSRVTATAAAATRTKVHQGEPLLTTVLVVPVGACGTEAGNPSPSFGDTGEAAATLAAASSPRTVPTIARTVAVMRRMTVMVLLFELADWLVSVGRLR